MRRNHRSHVVDYLLKPIQFERFLRAIHKVTPPTAAEAAPHTVVKSDAYLYFRTERKMVKVMLDDVLYVEGMKNYVKIFTGKGVVITKHSMAAIEAMLPDTGFMRVHRSYIVSRKKVTAFNSEAVTLGDVEVPVGRLFKSEVLKALK